MRRIIVFAFMDDSPDTKIETRTKQIGSDLFARSRAAGSGEGPIDRFLMNVGMRDETLKAQLFRFVDVLPVLNTPSQINRHLQEYLGQAHDRLPFGTGKLLPFMPTNGLLGKPLASLALASARRMARRFIAGTNLTEAINTIRSLRGRALTFTIDLLGEAVLSGNEAMRYQAEYLSLVEGLSAASSDWATRPQIDADEAGRALPKVNVSVKLSSLYSQFDPIDPEGTSRAVRERLRPILRAARQRGVFVNIDMEQSSYKEATLRIFREVFYEDEFRDWPDVGIAIQAYLKSCGDDLKSLADWARNRGTPVWVRLVKGAYWDYETVIAAQNDWPVPVFGQKEETDANFEKQTEFLFANADVLRPAIASHNIRSIAHAIAVAEERNLPPRSYEFQMLYGMADPIKSALIGLGHRVRVYTPYGQLLPGMAYLVRRLLENTSNESFLRAGFADNVPEEQLLMNPLARLKLRFGVNPIPQAMPTSAFRNEPLTDFSEESARQAMRSALASVLETSKQRPRFPLVIDGQRKETGKWIDAINPSDNSHIVGQCAAATKDDALASIAAAKAAFPAWRDMTANRRAAYLVRVAQILRRRRFELAAWEVYETAKPWREADADIAEAIDFCDYYAHEMLRLAEPQRSDVPGEDNETFYEPRGIAVIIAPWNFPLAILCGMTTAALVTGNTAIMKPAEQSGIIAAKLMEIFEEAGLPKGVVNFLPGIGEEIGPTLVSHPDVSIIAFTGSREVGLMIQRQAAETHEGQDHIKRVITELGGKNAAIVDEDADLDEAVHGVVMSAFGYSGQKCSACSRAIVLEPLYDAFLNRLIEATRSLNVLPADDPGCTVGPVINQEARERILRMIEKGKAESRLVYAANVGPLTEKGSFVGPHVFADVSPSASIAQDEIFGPVLAVIKAKDLTDALNIANNTRYALTGGLFSRSPANIERVRKEFRVGNLYINRKITGALVGRQPFGGFKLSGVGSKAGGSDYLQQFMVPRTITENTLRRGFAPQSEQPSGE